MHNKTKVFQLMIVLLLLLSLCSCQSIAEMFTDYETIAKNENYSVINRDGQYFIRFHAHTIPPKVPYLASMLKAYAEFSSMDEMKQAVFTGNIPQDYYSQMQYAHQGKREIPICDLNTRYEPYLAPGWWIESVFWEETYYYFKITDGVHSGRFTCFQTNESLYNLFHEGSLKFFSANEKVSIRSAIDRDATVYELRDRTMVHSMINAQNRQLSIMEYYLFPNHYYIDYIDEFNPKPDGITVYGAENGHFYELEINALTSRPSLDWLLSFGIQERVSE